MRLLDECVDVGDIDIMARFITIIYKVTQGLINGADELEILRAKDETVTLSNILELLSSVKNAKIDKKTIKIILTTI